MTGHEHSISGMAGRGRAATNRFPRRAVMRASASSAAFVARLIGRHGAAVTSGIGDAREFRRERGAGGVASHQHWHSTWSPRFVFSMASASTVGRGQAAHRVNAGGESEVASPASTSMVSAIPTVARYARVDRLTATIAPMMAVRGGEVAPALRADTPAAQTPTLPRQPTAAVARVLRRPPATAAASASIAAAAPPLAPAFTSPLERYASAPGATPTMPAMLGAIDVEGLADRVVRVIDRRLVAARERHGRI